jgi:tetratricopeptide (TPR) repeat protein
MAKVGFKSKLIAVIFIVLMVGCNSGQSFDERAVQSYYKGLEYAIQGKFNESKDEFSEALNIEPAFGVAKYSLELIEDAIGQKIKSKTAIHLFKGIDYRRQGKWDEAIAEFNKAIEINPRYAKLYDSRGYVYFVMSDFDNAISDSSKAIEINPNYANAYATRAGAYYFLLQYDEAISDNTRAIELDPMDATNYINRGNVYDDKGDTEKACSDWKRACELGNCSEWGTINKILCFGT